VLYINTSCINLEQMFCKQSCSGREKGG